MDNSLEKDEIELIIINQRASMKAIEIELKRIEIKKQQYLDTKKSLEIKIAENEARLAELK